MIVNLKLGKGYLLLLSSVTAKVTGRKKKTPQINVKHRTEPETTLRFTLRSNF